MNVSDLCFVCQFNMRKKEVVRFLPCRHLLHKKCKNQLTNHTTSCPICRAEVVSEEDVQRRSYNAAPKRERDIIVKAAREFKEWKPICASLGVKISTAYKWIKADTTEPLSRKYSKTKALTDAQIDALVDKLGEDTELTMDALVSFVATEFGKNLNESTIRKYLYNKCWSYKGLHYEPVEMNSDAKKRQRRDYVQQLHTYIEQGNFI